jgi:preprotein translocase subunit SecA
VLDPDRLVADLAAGKTTGLDPEAAAHPHIQAKGLARNGTKAPLTYSAPSLSSEAPDVHTESAGQGGDPSANSNRANAARQRRANPNRGSRGNKRKR